MERKSIKTGLTPTVVVESVQGGLQVKGWDRSEVFAKAGETGALTLEEKEAKVILSCTSECILRVPRSATVQIGEVHGNLRAKYLDRRLSVETVHGSLGMRNIDDVQVGTIHGDLLVKQVRDNLHVEEVQGNAIIWDVQGACTLRQVRGKLDLHDVIGSVSASAQAHVRAVLNLIAGERYEIASGGHLHCQTPEDANLEVDITSQAAVIEVAMGEQKQTYHQAEHHLVLGQGGPRMTLSAQEEVHLSCREGDWEEPEEIDMMLNEEFTRISDEFSSQIESQIEAQMALLDEQMARLSETISKAGLSRAEAQRLVQRAQASGEQAAARAQEKMLRAQERLERKLAAAQRKAEIKARDREQQPPKGRTPGWSFDWRASAGKPSGSQTGSASSDLQEERLIILRMLEEKKITLDEAEKLLAALEGK